MDELPILFAVVLGIVSALFVVWPLLRRSTASDHDLDAHPIDELHEEKEKLLRTLKEIEFDHQTGKLSDEDFRELKADYRGRALAILKRLEEATPERDLLAQVEADVSRAMGRKAAAGPRVCAGCGERIASDARFCFNCGIELSAVSG